MLKCMVKDLLPPKVSVDRRLDQISAPKIDITSVELFLREHQKLKAEMAASKSSKRQVSTGEEEEAAAGEEDRRKENVRPSRQKTQAELTTVLGNTNSLIEKLESQLKELKLQGWNSPMPQPQPQPQALMARQLAAAPGGGGGKRR